MSMIAHLNHAYDGIAILCGDGAQAMGFIKYLVESFGKIKTDILTMPGGTRALSRYEEEGHELLAENMERLNVMHEAMLIALATYLDHGGDEIHLCDHFKCGFWFDYRNLDKAKAAQIASMWRTVRIIQDFISRLRDDPQYAQKYKVNPSNIRVKKYVLHYATLNEGGDLENIQQVGELAVA